MADLMAKIGNKQSFVKVKKGEVLQGRITKLTSSEILVDINAKTEAVVLEKDKRILRTLLSNLKVGDQVTVSVLNPESDTGNPVVSLRRHIDDILWKDLEGKQKTQEKISGVIKEVTRGGFLVDAQLGVSGFLPNSQSIVTPEEDLLGKKIDLYVLELDRSLRKIIFSQKRVLDKKDFELATKNLKNGQKIEAIVSNIASFGIFVNLPTSETQSLDGLIHVSEISWETTNPDLSIYTPGEKIECVIIGIDKEAKRIDLSIKKLTQDPFADLVKKIAVDQKISGKVLKVDDNGVVVEIVVDGEAIEGIIKKEKIPVGTKYEEGQEITATVSQVDSRRRRILLVPVLLRKTIGYR